MRSYDPSRVLYLPGREIYGYWTLLGNVPDVLAKVSNIFAEKNINIVGISDER